MNCSLYRMRLNESARSNDTCVINSATVDWLPYLFIFLGLLGVGIIVFVRVYGSRQRKIQLSEAAKSLGLVPSKMPFTRSDRKKLPLFSRGNSRKVSNVWGGQSHGLETYLFEYRYRFGLPLIASVIYYQTVIAIRLRPNPLPLFRLAPSTSLDRAASSLGMKTVDLPKPSKLASLYLLYGDNVFQLQAAITAALPALEENIVPLRLTVESGGDWIIFYGWGKLLNRNTIVAAASSAFAFLQSMAHVQPL
jgi:hypothetical protein